MNRSLLPLVLFVSLGIRPGAALAEEPNPDETRRVVLDYASCVVKWAHDKVARTVLADGDNNVIKHDLAGFISGDCVALGIDTMKFDGDLYRYALADALVRSEFANQGPSDFSDRPPLTHRQAPTKSDIDAALANVTSAKKRDALMHGFEAQNVVAALSQYGECVVRADPTDARLWILTKPGSTEEANRIDALRPSFGICLKNGKVVFSKATLRGTVALNYYRLAHAPIQPAVEKTG